MSKFMSVVCSVVGAVVSMTGNFVYVCGAAVSYVGKKVAEVGAYISSASKPKE